MATKRSAYSVAVVDHLGDEAEALRLLGGDPVTGEQVALGAHQAHGQRPDHRPAVARGQGDGDVAVGDARVAIGDDDVGQQAEHQARAGRRALHGADHGLVEVDVRVHQFTRLHLQFDQRVAVAEQLLHVVVVGAHRERPAGAGDEHHADVVVDRQVAQDGGELAVLLAAAGVGLVGTAQGDVGDVVAHLGAQERVPRIVRTAHSSSSSRG
jgi:hypothetical protein